ncbi:uncharacterized protein LOC128632919 [Ictalurus punctatus]|uniref:Uncharacterized protein LOC128632919 n=1 Tax=Ictalurus punctatus TaxID=7998 RepID=A0A9F7R7E8_ICTPU|nr:uncharacterized protein LOC128632919 [Ictalurus punctatus]
MLCLMVIGFLLSCADCTKSYERKTLHQMNRAAFKGETVVFHCNGTLTSESHDIGWRKDRNGIFIHSSVTNQSVFNYTSSRMQVNPRNPRELQISDVQLSDKGLYSCFPLDKQWILTIEENEIQTSKGRLSYIVFSVITVCVSVCLFIFCAVCLHRKQENRGASDQTHTGNKLANKDSLHHSETITSCVYIMTSSNNVAIDYN